MVIEKDRVVTIDYKLRNSGGEVIDSSDGSDPLVYIHGNDNIIAGLEKHLLGKQSGDKVDCVVPAKEAYGERDESLVFKVTRAEFGEGAEIEVGMQFEAHGEGGAQIVTVAGIEGDEVTIDANHPLAGEELHFSVAVVEVREATAEELAHGHIHAAGGCGCGEGCDDECGDDCGCDHEGHEHGSGCGCH
jgi:FKBP-type peptidyl-prolyl cis-trans isomerase SlyD